MEWFKSQLQLARGGDKGARRRLLIFGVGAVVAIALLISGQTQTKSIRIKPNQSSENKIQVSS